MPEAPYTTQLQAGLGLLEETKILLELYEEGDTASILHQKSLNSGRFSNVTDRRLRNVVTECFAPRYIKSESALHLKSLLPCLDRQSMQQLFLIHTADANTILRDFISEVYWPRYSSGYGGLNPEAAKEFVVSAVQHGKTTTSWSESTIKRVSGYLVSCCADYGMLSSSRQGERSFENFHIEDTTFFYLAHLLHFKGLGDNAVINHPDWMLFGLEPSDVADNFKRTSRKGWYIVQSAGSILRINWSYPNMQEAVHVIAER